VLDTSLDRKTLKIWAFQSTVDRIINKEELSCLVFANMYFTFDVTGYTYMNEKHIPHILK